MEDSVGLALPRVQVAGLVCLKVAILTILSAFRARAQVLVPLREGVLQLRQLK